MHKPTYDNGAGCNLLSRGSSGSGSMCQEIAERQGRCDDLTLLLKVQVIQTVAPLRSSGDYRHRLALVMMMVMVILSQLIVLLVFLGLLIAGLARHKVDAAHAYRHDDVYTVMMQSARYQVRFFFLLLLFCLS